MIYKLYEIYSKFQIVTKTLHAVATSMSKAPTHARVTTVNMLEIMYIRHHKETYALKVYMKNKTAHTVGRLRSSTPRTRTLPGYNNYWARVRPSTW